MVTDGVRCTDAGQVAARSSCYDESASGLIQINRGAGEIRHAAIPDTERTAMTDPASLAQHIYPFDARGIGKRFRHAAIFGALDALLPGEAMRFVNDHNPVPLLAQLRQCYGEKLDIQYRQHEAGAIVIDFTIVAAANDGKGCGCGCGCN
jgi:uncharacterized protein (DUF2249 family)